MALETLTPEQEKMLDAVGDEYIALLHRGDEIDLEAVRPMLETIYGYYEMRLPDIEVCDSPKAMQQRAKDAGCADAKYDAVGISDAEWVSQQDAYMRLGVLTADEEKEIKRMIAFVKGGVYDTILCDERAFICRYPHTVKTNAAGDLHSASGPAIAWRDGVSQYSWNGVLVPAQVIDAPESMTRDDLLALNTEQRRAYCEHYGWDKALTKMGMELKDRWTDPGTGLAYELFQGADLQILRKESPKLQDGSQPWYAEPVHQDLNTAQAARKWQAMCRRGSNPATVAAECNKDPVLTYGQET